MSRKMIFCSETSVECIKISHKYPLLPIISSDHQGPRSEIAGVVRIVIVVHFWPCSPITYNVQRTMYNVQRTMYNVQCTTYYVLRTTYNVQRTMYNVLRTTYYILRTTYYVLRTTYYVRRTSYVVRRTSCRTTYSLKIFDLSSLCDPEKDQISSNSFT